jgi:excisionase family DNA binding protein
MDINSLITPDQAAPIIGVGVRQVYRLIHDGHLPSVRVGGRHLLRSIDARRAKTHRPPPGNPQGNPLFGREIVGRKKIFRRNDATPTSATN